MPGRAAFRMGVGQGAGSDVGQIVTDDAASLCSDSGAAERVVAAII
jgi:hypothetical protein